MAWDDFWNNVNEALGIPSAEARGAAPSVRFNNPGAIMYAGPNSWQATYGATSSGVGLGGHLAVFPSAQDGFAAAAHLQGMYENSGFQSLNQRINRYAPANAPGNTQASVQNYVNYLSQQMGISPDQPFSISDQTLGPKFLQAQAQFESGDYGTPFPTSALATGYQQAVGSPISLQAAAALNVDTSQLPATAQPQPPADIPNVPLSPAVSPGISQLASIMSPDYAPPSQFSGATPDLAQAGISPLNQPAGASTNAANVPTNAGNVPAALSPTGQPTPYTPYAAVPSANRYNLQGGNLFPGERDVTASGNRLPGGVFGPVAQLQTMLAAAGLYDGHIDGIYGRQTAAAVSQLNNVPNRSVYGPAEQKGLLAREAAVAYQPSQPPPTGSPGALYSGFTPPPQYGSIPAVMDVGSPLLNTLGPGIDTPIGATAPGAAPAAAAVSAPVAAAPTDGLTPRQQQMASLRGVGYLATNPGGMSYAQFQDAVGAKAKRLGEQYLAAGGDMPFNAPVGFAASLQDAPVFAPAASGSPGALYSGFTSPSDLYNAPVTSIPPVYSGEGGTSDIAPQDASLGASGFGTDFGGAILGGARNAWNWAFGGDTAPPTSTPNTYSPLMRSVVSGIAPADMIGPGNRVMLQSPWTSPSAMPRSNIIGFRDFAGGDQGGGGWSPSVAQDAFATAFGGGDGGGGGSNWSPAVTQGNFATD